MHAPSIPHLHLHPGLRRRPTALAAFTALATLVLPALAADTTALPRIDIVAPKGAGISSIPGAVPIVDH